MVDRMSMAQIAAQLAEFNATTEKVMGHKPIDPRVGIPDWALQHRKQLDEARSVQHDKVPGGDIGAGEDA